MFASGARLTSFPEPHNSLFALTQNESVVLTILVIVATINAVNFIDGLDGLAAGIVCIAAISFFVYYYWLAKVVGLSAEAVPALASIVLAGACLGFLPHNFYPARIFMGDTGSMLLGLLLAYVPIWAINSLDFTSLNYKANRFAEILPLLLPAAVLVIPYVDMLRAVVRRTRAGMSPFAADRKHLHHTMLEIGHSHRSSVLILYAWAALFAGTVVGLSILKVQPGRPGLDDAGRRARARAAVDPEAALVAAEPAGGRGGEPDARRPAASGRRPGSGSGADPPGRSGLWCRMPAVAAWTAMARAGQPPCGRPVRVGARPVLAWARTAQARARTARVSRMPAACQRRLRPPGLRAMSARESRSAASGSRVRQPARPAAPRLRQLSRSGARVSRLSARSHRLHSSRSVTW